MGLRCLYIFRPHTSMCASGALAPSHRAQLHLFYQGWPCSPAASDSDQNTSTLFSLLVHIRSGLGNWNTVPDTPLLKAYASKQAKSKSLVIGYLDRCLEIINPIRYSELIQDPVSSNSMLLVFVSPHLALKAYTHRFLFRTGRLECR